MRSKIRRESQVRVLAPWLALLLLFWQTLLAAGAIERPMAPVQFDGESLVICTEHGLQALPADGGAPAHPASDHSMPSCPCCMPFAAGNGLILSDAPQVAAPAWIAAPPTRAPLTAAQAARVAFELQQPRAPPLSV
jgi:hypothetical protein